MIELVQGDITEVRAEILVTAANSGLRGGGGVDGAIHRAAGPDLLRACRAIGSCPVGSAVITPSFELERRGVIWVIHAVGPIWQGGSEGEAELLVGAYERSLELAADKGVESIAFPSISTGTYGFPIARAAPLAVAAARRWMQKMRPPRRVLFALFDAVSYAAFERATR